MGSSTIYTGPFPITNNGSLISIDVANASFSGDIINSSTGIITAGTAASSKTGISVNNSTINGAIVNQGTINATAVSTGSGILISNNALITGGITNSGSLSAAFSGIDISASTFPGGVTNSGTISVGAAGIGVGFFVSIFAGGITNSQSGTISAGTGIFAGFLLTSFSGGITNAGMISATGNGIWVGGPTSVFSGGISNSGAISAGGDGILVAGNGGFGGGTSQTGAATVSTFSGGITNSGTISAGDNGILVGGQAPGAGGVHNLALVTVSSFTNSGAMSDDDGIINSGTITSGNNGIFVGGNAILDGGSNNIASVTISVFSGGIANASVISASVNGIVVGGNAQVTGGTHNAASVTISTFAGGVNNSGKITADDAGILIGGPAQVTGGTDNTALVAIPNFSGGISNGGTITGRTGVAIIGASGFSGAVVNTGNITGTGGIALNFADAGTALIIDQQSGTISGAIDLSPDGDTLNISGGAIAGNIAGQNDGDTVNFDLGVGTFTYANSISQVNGITINSGIVQLDGAISSAAGGTGLTIASATLLVGTGGSVAPDIADDGTLGFNQTGAYTYGGVISGTGMVEQRGLGTTALTGSNTFTGGVTIGAGTLLLGNIQAAGSGTITFDANADATLKIDSGDIPANTIDGFIAGDTIDLAGIPVDKNGGAQLTGGNVLQVSEDGATSDLQLDQSASYAGDFFHVAADSSGAGVAVTLIADPVLTVDGDSATPVGQAGAGDVGFTVTGLDAGDTGAVTFTDSNGQNVVVDIAAGETAYSADLSGLADGTVTSSLTIADNAAEPLAGNSVTLDQDKTADVSVAIMAGLDGDNHPIEGTPLTATLTIAGPSGAQPSTPTTYTWFVDGGEVQSGTSATFTPAAVDEGQTVNVTASYDDLGGNQVTATSTATNAVLEAPPTITAASSNISAEATQVFTASALFSASDLDSSPILSYEVEDESTAASNGFWTLNGLVEPSGQMFTVTAAELSDLSFVAGSSTSGSTIDTLEVAASDAGGFGAFTTFTVTVGAHAPGDVAAVVTASNQAAQPGTTLAATSLFSASVPAGETIVSYEVEDTTANSGHWVSNGTVEPANQLVDVTAAELSELSFQAGYGDTLMVRANDGTQWGNFTTFTIQPPPNPQLPAATTADMILRNGDGNYEIYDLGDNTILAAGYLGQVGVEWQGAGLGDFDGTDTSDMLLRNVNTGAFEVYDISNNNIIFAAGMGQVGLEWSVAGLGDFSSRPGETDMVMRNSNTGVFEVYDIANNAITFAAGMGQVGMEWSVAGFGDFSTQPNESDMLMRNSNTGAFEVYDINNNTITLAAGMGQVGLEWQVAGFGDFSGNANETDMLMRNSNTGAFEVFDISNNAITSYAPMGQVGLEWTIAGFGDFSGNANETDMLMRNSNSGAFEVYDISNNAITSFAPIGQVGLEWSISGVSATPAVAAPATQLSGVAADPAGAPSSATAQFTQAMASFALSGNALATHSALDQVTPVPTIATSLLTASNHI